MTVFGNGLCVAAAWQLGKPFVVGQICVTNQGRRSRREVRASEWFQGRAGLRNPTSQGPRRSSRGTTADWSGRQGDKLEVEGNKGRLPIPRDSGGDGRSLVSSPRNRSKHSKHVQNSNIADTGDTFENPLLPSNGRSVHACSSFLIQIFSIPKPPQTGS